MIDGATGKGRSLAATAAQPEQRDLLARSQRGDAEAYGMIVKQHQARIHGYILRMVRDPTLAEDLTQEAFIRAYRKLHLYDLERPFLPWLFRLSANLTQNHLRAASRRELPLAPERLALIHSTEAPSDERAGQRQLLHRVDRALDQLAPKYRAPMVLKHVEGLRYAEISQVLGVSAKALKMRVSRARAQLRKLIDAETGEV